MNVVAGNKTVTSPLSSKGEINLWLFLERLPIIDAKIDLKKQLDEDKLAKAGGEAAALPKGGDKLELGAVTGQWRPLKLAGGYYDFVNNAGKGGLYQENTVNYLYSVIQSPKARKVVLKLGSDDAFKVFFNGKLIDSKFYQRGTKADQDSITLELKKGKNRLLLRVDNYKGSAGVYTRILDSEGNPAKLTVSIETSPDTEMIHFNDTLNFHFSNVTIKPLLPEAGEELFGARIQRTMTLLATSNKTTRKKVRILFFGQSIVAQSWYKIIEKNLRDRFPYAELLVENHAIGGYTAPALVRTAVHNLYPFYPDLVVFHDYGGEINGELERMIYNLRKYTTAEIMIFTHHFRDEKRVKAHAFDTISSQNLEFVAQKYNCELVNVRREWERYLKQYKIKPSEMLGDAIHPNKQGGKLLAELILKHFKYNTLFPGGWFDLVKTYDARRFKEEAKDEIQLIGPGWRSSGSGAATSQQGDKLTLRFRGNSVDVIAGRSYTKWGSAKVLIDGVPPSKHKEIYFTTLPNKAFGAWWPALNRVTLGGDSIKEDWTLTMTSVNEDASKFSFALFGSKTGDDGKGDSGMKLFKSKSGRIIFKPRELTIKWAQSYSKKKCPENFEIKWRTTFKGTDVWKPVPSKDHAVENSYILAQGLSNGEHTLEIIANGDGTIPIKSVRVFTPPLR